MNDTLKVIIFIVIVAILIPIFLGFNNGASTKKETVYCSFADKDIPLEDLDITLVYEFFASLEGSSEYFEKYAREMFMQDWYAEGYLEGYSDALKGLEEQYK